MFVTWPSINSAGSTLDVWPCVELVPQSCQLIFSLPPETIGSAETAATAAAKGAARIMAEGKPGGEGFPELVVNCGRARREAASSA